MIITKYHYYLILLVLLFSVLSCEKKTTVVVNEKQTTKEIEQSIKLGSKFYKDSKFDSSFYYFNKAKLACEPKINVQKYVYSIMYLASILQMNGDFASAESITTEAIPYVSNVKNQKLKWRIYSLIGLNYIYTLDYMNAINYFNKSIKLQIDLERKLTSVENIGYTYLQMQKYDIAIQILEPLLSKKEIINNPQLYSTTLNYLGYCYYKTENSKSLSYLTKALDINLNQKKLLPDECGLTSSYQYLYEYYSEKNEKQAIKFANLLYQKATELNSVDDRLIALTDLIKHSNGNQLKQYSLQYISINDSITKVRQIAKNQFAKIKYDSKKDKAENLQLKAEKALKFEQQKFKNLILYLAICITFIAAVFIISFLIKKNKKEQLKTSYETEIRISKKLHDELANDLYQTIAFTETSDLNSNKNKEKLLENLDSIYSTTRNISRENSLIETGAHYKRNLKDMISHYNSTSVSLALNNLDNINWKKIDGPKKIIIHRTLQELMVNMKKHSKCTFVIISFKSTENDLTINYLDNGIGVNLEKTKIRNGLLNIENKIHIINGRITFESAENLGFKAQLIIPI